MKAQSEQERLVFVIRATNIVETKMKQVIASYIQAPTARLNFVHSHLLNNATVSFAAKLKLVLAIAKTLSIKMNREAMHTMLSRRNAFAHQDHLNSVRVVTRADCVPDVAFVVESIRGSGELETVTQEQAFSEFVSAYVTAEADLDALLAGFENQSFSGSN